MREKSFGSSLKLILPTAAECSILHLVEVDTYSCHTDRLYRQVEVLAFLREATDVAKIFLAGGDHKAAIFGRVLVINRSAVE
jgi:hypothetical protein